MCMWYVHVCIWYVHVCMWYIDVYMRITVECQVFLSIIVHFIPLQQGLSPTLELGMPSASAIVLCLPSCSARLTGIHANTGSFYIGAGDLNSALHDCASALTH